MNRRLWIALGTLGLVAPGISTVTPAASAAATHAPMIGTGAPPPGLSPHVVGAPTAVTSSNWSGYADTGATFTSVSGSWTQPAVTCTKKQVQFSSFWVGIDGYSDKSVEQLGTDSDCQGKNRPAYYAWFEMYPGPSEELPTGHAVEAGDVLTASVTWVKGNTFTLSMNDSSGWSFNTTQALTKGSALRSSAEWIAEAPSTCGASCRVLPLADFGSVPFTAASEDGHPISAATDEEITMTKGRHVVKARPSALAAGGAAFNVTWSHA
jgi:hypothetical protein